MIRSIAMGLGLLGATAAAATAAGTMSADEIREDIVGRRIYLATPLGGEFPLTYHKNGSVTGDGEALGLGKFVQPTDSGTWWIKADRLCQKFQTWYDGKPMCFELIRLAPDKLEWIRDNGDKGTARIGG